MFRLEFSFEGVAYRRFSHLFAASACGRILHMRRMAPAKLRTRPDGYLEAGGRPHGGLVHRIVAICWLDRPQNANAVHHLNGDKTDNRAANLEWLSQSEHARERHDLSENGRYHRTDATKEKLRAYRLGRRSSEETKQKQREANLRLGIRPPSPKGRPITAGMRRKMSDNSTKKVACEVFGVRYSSFTEAGRALGERPLSLRKRCLSPNFPEYRVLDE